MAIVGCSPSPRKHPQRSQEEQQQQEEEEDEDENVRQLQDCASLYKCLEDCLVRTDRNWRACQKEVKALKECHISKAKMQAPSSKPVTVSQ